MKDPKDMKVLELKAELGRLGLPVHGLKKDLVARLKKALKDQMHNGAETDKENGTPGDTAEDDKEQDGQGPSDEAMCGTCQSYKFDVLIWLEKTDENTVKEDASKDTAAGGDEVEDSSIEKENNCTEMGDSWKEDLQGDNVEDDSRTKVEEDNSGEEDNQTGTEKEHARRSVSEESTNTDEKVDPDPVESGKVDDTQVRPTPSSFLAVSDLYNGTTWRHRVLVLIFWCRFGSVEWAYPAHNEIGQAI